MLIDTHCHIQFQAYKDDRGDVIRRCREKGMVLNVVGTQKDTSRLAVELAEANDGMVASIGTHPNHLFPTHIDEEETHFVSREEDFDEAYYETLVRSPKVVAIGETGLDLFHLPADIPVDTVLDKQKKVFAAHYAFAKKHDKALVIHCRDAHEPLLALLESYREPIRGNVHCYTANWAYAERYLALGLHIGFTGVITFPPRKSNPQAQADLLDVVKRIPLDRVVVETDAPYLAPIPHRGERAEPWMVESVIGAIAQVKDLPVAQVAAAAEQNAITLFRLPI
jgi:TatD DNase family protein